MKKSVVFLFGILLLFSCGSSNQKKNEEVAVMTVDQIQEKGKDLVGSEVIVKGIVSHVCSHSGARCFLMGSTEDVSIRVEAGKIGSFSQEKMGTELQIRGILMEVQLDEEDLAELENSAAVGDSANKDHALGHSGPAMHDIDGGNHDSTNQAKKLDEINQKLAESEAGYVPIYFIEGLELMSEKK